MRRKFLGKFNIFGLVLQKNGRKLEENNFSLFSLQKGGERIMIILNKKKREEREEISENNNNFSQFFFV